MGKAKRRQGSKKWMAAAAFALVFLTSCQAQPVSSAKEENSVASTATGKMEGGGQVYGLQTWQSGHKPKEYESRTEDISNVTWEQSPDRITGKFTFSPKKNPEFYREGFSIVGLESAPALHPLVQRTILESAPNGEDPSAQDVSFTLFSSDPEALAQAILEKDPFSLRFHFIDTKASQEEERNAGFMSFRLEEWIEGKESWYDGGN